MGIGLLDITGAAAIQNVQGMTVWKGPIAWSSEPSHTVNSNCAMRNVLSGLLKHFLVSIVACY
jgi:hypothetical protein